MAASPSKQTWSGSGGPPNGPPKNPASAEPAAKPGRQPDPTTPGSMVGTLPPPPSLPQMARPGAADVSAVTQPPAPTANAAAGLDAVMAPTYSPEEALDEQIGDLEAWASSILRRIRIDATRFWTLRALSFCAAAASVGLALKGFERLPVGLIALAALGSAIEMGWPGSSLRQARRRAVYELRELQGSVKLRWQKVRLSHPDPTSRKRVAHAVELLEMIHSRQKEIANLLGSSEPNLGINRHG